MVKKRCFLSALAVMLAFETADVQALDLKQYDGYVQQKKYRAALSILKDETSNLVNQLNDSLKKAFPKSTSVWSQAPASPFDDEMGLHSSGMMASIMYSGKTPEQTLSVSLLVDHPDIEQYEGMIKSPPQSEGIKPLKIKDGSLGIQKYDSVSKTAEVNILVGNQMLLNVVGTDIRSVQEVTDFVEAVDLKLIRNLLN